jgi:hypothetical protein
MSNVIDITGNWKVKTITKFLSTLFSHETANKKAKD